ncbi:hypothetical protein DFH08DRAFT_3117 [Mycena albidolilacea]|uniref:Uncharacterized protein n=1 Tax=Mycena albidolilacea TaxID=1033008 RepID=A0AAD7F3L3_9AGAR|nr:hypothetical protein DFH08DRAFT_3117 [Mycena albidolilacea]
MPTLLNQDVFSRILSHVCESLTVYEVLKAIPKSHAFFLVALHRLCELPIYLDTYDPRAATASNQILDYLLSSHQDEAGIAESIRHLVCLVEHDKYATRLKHADEDETENNDREEDLQQENEEGSTADSEEDVDKGEEPQESEGGSIADSEEDVDVEAFHRRLPALFSKMHQLESIDYHNTPGLGLSSDAVDALATCGRLRTLAVDVTIPRRYTSSEESWADPDSWDIEPFLASLGSSVTSLDLRHISQTMFLNLVSHADILATYEHLSSLRMVLYGDGVWDWDGFGSPNRSASVDFIFPSLKIPALRRLELVVGDLTISKPRSSGTPLHLVDSTLLTELSLEIHQCNLYYHVDTIRLFEGISYMTFPALAHLEIKDSNTNANGRLSWGDTSHTYSREFPGLVTPFLGALESLTTLWVDEQVLLPQFSALRFFWNIVDHPDWDTDMQESVWAATLRDVLGRVESLRVGFGMMDDTEVGYVLGACDPAKLRQFGFEWAWKEYGQADPLSPALLAHLARFPKLTDVHILFPRPETQVCGAPNPTIDLITLADVASIFRCNPRISRVGIGNSVVWERHPGRLQFESSTASRLDTATPAILLVSDGSAAPHAGVPRFFHAGYLAKRRPGEERGRAYDDNTTPLRPERGEEIEELRDLLRRILVDDAS